MTRCVKSISVPAKDGADSSGRDKAERQAVLDKVKKFSEQNGLNEPISWEDTDASSLYSDHGKSDVTKATIMAQFRGNDPAKSKEFHDYFVARDILHRTLPRSDITDFRTCLDKLIQTFAKLEQAESNNPKMKNLLNSLRTDLTDQIAHHDKLVAEIECPDPAIKKFFNDANGFIDLNSFENVKKMHTNRDGNKADISNLETQYYAALAAPNLLKVADPKALQQRFYAIVVHASKINTYNLTQNGPTLDAWATRLGV